MKEIPTHVIQQWISPESKRLKERAPQYLYSFMEARNLAVSNFYIEALASGETSASYYLEGLNSTFVLKIKPYGASAESETLRAWHSGGVHVPNVLDVGLIKGTLGEVDVQYLQLEAIMDRNDQIAQLGYEFIDGAVFRAAEIGKLMGTELAKMHAIPSVRKFGLFGDRSGKTYFSWNEYLLELLQQNTDYLFHKGITQIELNHLRQQLRRIDFPEAGNYIHSDFGVHNILVADRQTLDIYVIDPDPQTGNPLFDLAAIMFRLQVSTIMHDLQPENPEIQHQYKKFVDCYQALVRSYSSQSRNRLDPREIAIHQVVTLLPKMSNREKKLKTWIHDGVGDAQIYRTEIDTYRLYLRGAIEKIT